MGHGAHKGFHGRGTQCSEEAPWSPVVDLMAQMYRRITLEHRNYCLLNETPNGDVDTTDLLRADESVSPQSIVKDYLERVRAVTSNRVILQGRSTIPARSPLSHSILASPISPTSVRTSEDLVGLGPLDTAKDDVIAILYGCSVPVILRPSGSYNRPQGYRFLGEAYIDGKMDAECMSEGHELMEFVLR